ncbi:MAG: hypothetical protein ABJ308_16030 [Halieaceae bacterium]
MHQIIQRTFIRRFDTLEPSRPVATGAAALVFKPASPSILLVLRPQLSYLLPAMKNIASQTRAHWLIAAMVMLLLGAQIAQSAHLHADHSMAPDCVQCSADGGQTALIAGAATPPCIAAIRGNNTHLSAAPFATFYRLAARGPPALSN